MCFVVIALPFWSLIHFRAINSILKDLAERLGDEATDAAEEKLAAHVAAAFERRQESRNQIGGDGTGRERSLLGADVDDVDAFEQLHSLGGSLRATLAESNAVYVEAEKAAEDHFEQEAEWLIKQGLAAQAAREANLPAARRAAKETREREKREKRAARAVRAQLNGTEASDSTDSEEEAARQRIEGVRSPSPVVDMVAVAAALEKDIIVARVARGKARRALAAAEVSWARAAAEDTETEVHFSSFPLPRTRTRALPHRRRADPAASIPFFCILFAHAGAVAPRARVVPGPPSHAAPLSYR